jgi:putative nucleotidyltransferase with HDIG domain
VLTLDDQLFLVVSEPARFAEEVLGTLTAGYRLDDALAGELARVTRCEVSFVSGAGLCGTSLPPQHQNAAVRFLSGAAPRLPGWGQRPSVQRLDGETYVGGIYPLYSDRTPTASGELLLLHPWKPTQSVLDEIRDALIYLGAFAFLLSLATGLVLSRRITRSLRDIAAAADEVAAGNWDRQAPVEGSVEAAMMGAAFNHMTANLRHYYEEARLQSDRRAEALEQLEESYTDTLRALSRALDTRDNETEGHSQRVTHFALCLARQLGLDRETRTTLELGALLHDIGKIGIPDAILLKPGPLTDEEMAVMRRHCELGVEIVRDIPHLQRAIEVIRWHHERYDGNGYPYGLAGERIPLPARVFAVADTLDALTSDRPYRGACSFSDALAEIQRCSGTQFDPHVVEALAAIVHDLQHWRRSGRPSTPYRAAAACV